MSVAAFDFKYGAFISYSHAADGRLAPALQRGLQQIGKPWFGRSVIKVFRDETSLSASPELWPEIERNLARCDFFILMASAEAASSPWVRKEVQWWLTHRTIDRLLIVVTDGKIAWNPGSNDFDWGRTTCLPPDLNGRFHGEPLYVDLRWAKERNDLSLRHAKFRDAVLTLAAPLHGRPKDELDSEEIQQHRRFRIAAWSALILLNTLTMVSIYYYLNARQEAANAEANWREARSRMLATAAIAKLEKDKNLDDAIKIAVMAWKLAPTSEAQAAIQRMAETSSDMARILARHTVGIAALAFSTDSTQLATVGSDGSIQLSKAGTWNPAGPVLAGTLLKAEGLRFDGTGNHLLAWSGDGTMELWDIHNRTKRVILKFRRPLPETRYADDVWHLALNSNGSQIAVGKGNDLLAIWDVKAESLVRAPVNLGGYAIIGLHFRPDDRLLVVQRQHRRIRVGVWDTAVGQMNLGPITKGEESFLTDGNHVSFSRNGSPFVVTGNHYNGGKLYEIGVGLVLREQLDIRRDIEGGRRVGSLEAASVDANGKYVFVFWKHSGYWEKWDLSATPGLVAKGSLLNWATPTWSADGHWRADLVREGFQKDGSKGERILLWNQELASPSGPAKAIGTKCDFRDNNSECVQRLCEKISSSLDEAYLRKLFGIENYEVMYERYKSRLNGSLCDHR